MRTYRCVCNNVIFFDNSCCVACQRELGHCPKCRLIVALLPLEAGNFQCGNAACGAHLAKCINYSQHDVCNRCVELPAGAVAAGTGATPEAQDSVGLCDCCRFNSTIPDLTVAGNQQKWYRLEASKRRLFYELSMLGLPYGTAADGVQPPLSFDFKADVIPKNNFWRGVGKSETIYTGHADGRITINIREADDVEREKLRVHMHEAHRTLIGHFRHEIGHYYWEVLVKGRREDQSRAVFGDHDHPTYGEALDAYYKNGPRPDWDKSFISAYATMHPWEDFAETWACYLDIVSALDTAHHNGFGGQSDPVHADLDAMVTRYQELGIALNELNRNMGLLDLVPEVIVAPVISKLRFIHELVQLGRQENGALAAGNGALAAGNGALAAGNGAPAVGNGAPAVGNGAPAPSQSQSQTPLRPAAPAAAPLPAVAPPTAAAPVPAAPTAATPNQTASAQTQNAGGTAVAVGAAG